MALKEIRKQGRDETHRKTTILRNNGGKGRLDDYHIFAAHTCKQMYLHPPALRHYEDLCNTSGPWTRLVFLSMANPTQNCLNLFQLYESNGVRAYGRPHPLTYDCQSVPFPVNQTSYSQICGRVIGYQYYSIDGFNSGCSMDELYVEGLGLTYGSPQQHIWSLAVHVLVGESHQHL